MKAVPKPVHSSSQRSRKAGEKGETQAFLESRRNLYDVLYEIGGNKELRGMVPGRAD